jgi:hypothetical protein
VLDTTNRLLLLPYIDPNAKIESLIQFLQALHALQCLHIDKKDLFGYDSDDSLLNFIPRTINVFVSRQPYSHNDTLFNLLQRRVVFEKFSYTIFAPADGLDNDIFMKDWRYNYGRTEYD